jgi:protein-tyrosine phosphatase
VTDLHTHILPGIDDGAQTVGESIALLQAELDDGVQTVALTPHFRTGISDQPLFLKRRGQSFDILREEIERHDLSVRLILGAEAAFSPELPDLDLDPLCYEGTKTLLIELPMAHYPPFAREVFYRLLLKGYTPLLAHIERYPYFVSHPELLEDLIHGGALAQINAGCLLGGGRSRKRALGMINSGLVRVMATDAHSMSGRPPQLKKAVRIVKKKLGSQAAESLVEGVL